MPLKLALLLAVVLSVGSALAQTTQPRGMTAQEVLDAADRFIQTVETARRAGKTAEANALIVEAHNALDAVVKADPRNVRAMVLAGELAALEGKGIDARTYFQGALEIEKANFRANLGLAKFYMGSHIWRQATTCLEKAESVAPPDRRSEVLRLLAYAYINQGKYSESVATAQKAVAADPEDFDSLYFLVQAYGQAKQYEQAVENARALNALAAKRRALEPSDRSALEHQMQAVDLYIRTLKDYHSTLYRRNARDEPTDELLPDKEAPAAQTLSEMASMTSRFGELQRELNYYDTLVYAKKAVEYEPDNTGYLLDLAGLLLATHQTDKAIETYQRILDVDKPSDTDPAAAARNKQTAGEFLDRLNAPRTSQPAPATERVP